MKYIHKDDAFTGLEAAIVLIAFVVVAAVFSYVVLGAGFFTTQKSQEVVHSSVGQSSSSVELIGDVYGLKDGVNQKIKTIEFSLGLTAGGTVIDMEATTLTFSDANNYYALEKTSDVALDSAEWKIIETLNPKVGGDVLEKGEQMIIQVQLKTDKYLDPNAEFTLEIKPAVGATMGITRTVPAQIDAVNLLY